MSLNIFEPVCIYEKGERENNEDSVFPSYREASEDDRLFVVCDGLGGHAYGEVASKIACEAVYDYSTYEDDFDPEKALSFVEMRLADFLENNPEFSGMATTLVVLKINQKNCLIGWVGDSRVYHIRDGDILYQTQDHSLINDLIRRGELKPEEAEYDYRKNIITNVVSGNNAPARIDHITISDIKSGDFFLLCSDGLLEKLDNDMIREHLRNSYSLGFIKESIENICRGNIMDNYSMYLIKIK